MTKKIVLRIPEDLYGTLMEIAGEERIRQRAAVSTTAVIVGALEAFVAQRRRRRPPRRKGKR